MIYDFINLIQVAFNFVVMAKVKNTVSYA